ncbi:MAG TPA: DUF2752 domain-containing protein [Pyrinomonadaceae bacterium]|nr:DUF2752 domain-containing protein [Pyrinomonadaceae bacterium]
MLRCLQVAAIWLVVIGAATYLFLFDPATSSGYPSCPFRTLTGLQCPGCGSTRALHQLLHGHPVAAFEFNPLLVLSLPFLALALLRVGRFLPTHDNPKNRIVSPSIGWLVLAVVVGFWVFRNTPFYPFMS